jgi:uncharacterized protein (TIGR03492 family)
LSSILLLSNGHGEDLSGALLGEELRARGASVEALPLVGHGLAYQRAGIPVVARTREFSTGGLGYTSLAGRLTELREGQFLHLLGLVVRLLQQRRRYRLVVAVGDLVPVLATWLAGLPGVVYLVAYSSHYEGRLRLPWPCGWLLRQPCFRQIWSRDALTAEDLSRQMKRPVTFLGNPFMDLMAEEADQPRPAPTCPSLAVLPGSRLPEACHNLGLILQLLPLLPAPLPQPGALRLRAALVRALEPESVAALAAPFGWRLESGTDQDTPARWVLVRQHQRLELHWGRFAAVLGASDLVLAMAGTASEQAVGLGKPVVQMAGRGPQFTAGFAEAQRRLLGPGLFCAPGPVGQPTTLQQTAQLIDELLTRLQDPRRGPDWRSRLAEIGAERIGSMGGSSRMAAAIMEAFPAPR